MDSGSTSKSEEKPKVKKTASNSNIRTFGTIGSTETGKIGSLKGSKLTFKPKIPARRKQIKIEEEDKPKKSGKERKGKKGFKDRERKSRGRPTYEPSALSGPFAQGAARPGVKKEYGSGRSYSGISSASGSGIRVEEETTDETKPKIENLKFRDIDDENGEEYYEEDEDVIRPISLIDLTQELNEKMEKIKIEEKNFTFKKIKFEDEFENNLNKVKKENEDRMETEDSTVTTTENEGETYNYPASDLLRNDIKPENNILFFQFPSVLPEIITNNMETDSKFDSSKVKIETADGKISKVDLDTNSSAPEGKFGKLIIYKSGKMKIKMGDILFDVNPGTDCNFYQNAFSFNTDKKEGYILGDIRKRYICTPDIESLLK
ncbi:hypothetical protein H8356DRAFT_931598 [Neocallimastix lanati (nom. inval.)]|jgi:hypothetical protein|uniref:DNA-directed RNA polymerase III subunit RPC4 n=1 Tax=Neocallimastix californiae TaxID=1754190 RepID=A0A1Y2F1V7_9FUNG|nr:hypothetical protein H8356DRAFT_931598 [Neocallimastix sp. JGI-2020a]ORY77849.1 hypothetical protein LY90DRAFT_665109 [Neocallimastix californiae]|eukprot:ORY77849.1 hypothetical protein LY90DRAFT_665109 [Neocallimastix californiae]